MIKALEDHEIDRILSQQFVGRIACHADNFIYLVPISYAYDGKYVYAHSQEGTKLAIMRKNPEVCFEVDNVKDMANWQSVIAWGTFQELKAEEDRQHALRVLLNRKLPLSSSITTHLGKTWPFVEDDLNDITGVVYRIELKKKTGKLEQTSTSLSASI
jgi:uncharacterized protein